MTAMAEQLRSDPVRRDEVRLIGRYSRIDEEHYYELTLPVGTFRLEGRNGYSEYVGDPLLWRPVLDQLAAEAEANYQAELRSFARLLTAAAERRPELLPLVKTMPPVRRQVPRPEISVFGAREYQCARCGKRFLCRLLPHRQPRLCSNKCEQERRAEISEGFNAQRGQRRAKARAGRTCAHCGIPFEAARSTRRFCSDICRVKAHRNADRERQEYNHSTG